MGVAEIIGFAACWVAVASLMLWGVFTEHRRGEILPPRARPPAGGPPGGVERRRPTDQFAPPERRKPVEQSHGADWPGTGGRRLPGWLRPTAKAATPGRTGADRSDSHPSRFGRTTTGEWVVAEQSAGGTPDVAERARFLAGAWLAMRGVDIEALHADDIRLEVATNGDGVSITRILVRARALQASRRRR